MQRVNVIVKRITTNSRPPPFPWYAPVLTTAQTGGRWLRTSWGYAGPVLGWGLGRSARLGWQFSWGTTKVLLKLALLAASFLVIGMLAACYGAMRLPKELR